jgi:ABC-2 type transport system ATP-binding protein
MHKPQVLILDEPTNGLDPTQIIEIRDLIKRLAQEATVIVSTHILTEVEATCHRAIIIMNGEIKADARMSELTSTSSAVVAINAEATGVETSLAGQPGVQSAAIERRGDKFHRYRVTGEKDRDLCPQIFHLAIERGWRLAELRQESRTLESVFRELAQSQGVQA